VEYILRVWSSNHEKIQSSRMGKIKIYGVCSCLD
jgi:hypothetical protein